MKIYRLITTLIGLIMCVQCLYDYVYVSPNTHDVIYLDSQCIYRININNTFENIVEFHLPSNKYENEYIRITDRDIVKMEVEGDVARQNDDNTFLIKENSKEFLVRISSEQDGSSFLVFIGKMLEENNVEFFNEDGVYIMNGSLESNITIQLTNSFAYISTNCYILSPALKFDDVLLYLFFKSKLIVGDEIRRDYIFEKNKTQNDCYFVFYHENIITKLVDDSTLNNMKTLTIERNLHLVTLSDPSQIIFVELLYRSSERIKNFWVYCIDDFSNIKHYYHDSFLAKTVFNGSICQKHLIFFEDHDYLVLKQQDFPYLLFSNVDYGFDKLNGRKVLINLLTPNEIERFEISFDTYLNNITIFHPFSASFMIDHSFHFRTIDNIHVNSRVWLHIVENETFPMFGSTELRFPLINNNFIDFTKEKIQKSTKILIDIKKDTYYFRIDSEETITFELLFNEENTFDYFHVSVLADTSFGSKPIGAISAWNDKEELISLVHFYNVEKCWVFDVGFDEEIKYLKIFGQNSILFQRVNFEIFPNHEKIPLNYIPEDYDKKPLPKTTDIVYSDLNSTANFDVSIYRATVIVIQPYKFVKKKIFLYLPVETNEIYERVFLMSFLYKKYDSNRLEILNSTVGINVVRYDLEGKKQLYYYRENGVIEFNYTTSTIFEIDVEPSVYVDFNEILEYHVEFVSANLTSTDSGTEMLPLVEEVVYSLIHPQLELTKSSYSNEESCNLVKFNITYFVWKIHVQMLSEDDKKYNLLSSDYNSDQSCYFFLDCHDYNIYYDFIEFSQVIGYLFVYKIVFGTSVNPMQIELGVDNIKFVNENEPAQRYTFNSTSIRQFNFNFNLGHTLTQDMPFIIYEGSPIVIYFEGDLNVVPYKNKANGSYILYSTSKTYFFQGENIKNLMFLPSDDKEIVEVYFEDVYFYIDSFKRFFVQLHAKRVEINFEVMFETGTLNMFASIERDSQFSNLQIFRNFSTHLELMFVMDGELDNILHNEHTTVSIQIPKGNYTVFISPFNDRHDLIEFQIEDFEVLLNNTNRVICPHGMVVNGECQYHPATLIPRDIVQTTSNSEKSIEYMFPLDRTHDSIHLNRNVEYNLFFEQNLVSFPTKNVIHFEFLSSHECLSDEKVGKIIFNSKMYEFTLGKHRHTLILALHLDCNITIPREFNFINTITVVRAKTDDDFKDYYPFGISYNKQIDIYMGCTDINNGFALFFSSFDDAVRDFQNFETYFKNSSFSLDNSNYEFDIEYDLYLSKENSLMIDPYYNQYLFSFKSNFLFEIPVFLDFRNYLINRGSDMIYLSTRDLITNKLSDYGTQSLKYFTLKLSNNTMYYFRCELFDTDFDTRSFKLRIFNPDNGNFIVKKEEENDQNEIEKFLFLENTVYFTVNEPCYLVHFEQLVPSLMYSYRLFSELAAFESFTSESIFYLQPNILYGLSCVVTDCSSNNQPLKATFKRDLNISNSEIFLEESKEIIEYNKIYHLQKNQKYDVSFKNSKFDVLILRFLDDMVYMDGKNSVYLGLKNYDHGCIFSTVLFSQTVLLIFGNHEFTVNLETNNSFFAKLLIDSEMNGIEYINLQFEKNVTNYIHNTLSYNLNTELTIYATGLSLMILEEDKNIKAIFVKQGLNRLFQDRTQKYFQLFSNDTSYISNKLLHFNNQNFIPWNSEKEKYWIYQTFEYLENFHIDLTQGNDNTYYIFQIEIRNRETVNNPIFTFYKNSNDVENPNVIIQGNINVMYQERGYYWYVLTPEVIRNNFYQYLNVSSKYSVTYQNISTNLNDFIESINDGEWFSFKKNLNVGNTFNNKLCVLNEAKTSVDCGTSLSWYINLYLYAKKVDVGIYSLIIISIVLSVVNCKYKNLKRKYKEAEEEKDTIKEKEMVHFDTDNGVYVANDDFLISYGSDVEDNGLFLQ
eukprot:TRINITY_DN1105_c0_g1_i1.p1 TRINITY_DN1105_c0_g1~~TRINITY_DN1105_c0_g1_i1.p1  ORF type:complete len:1904 (-),score=433.31 TRINITY_DN1105_c0_g1_i1:69-5780(-)